MNQQSEVVSPPRTLAYEADLLGNIQQVMAGLQGYETMALELLQNADDAGATVVRFDVRNNALLIRHNSEFSSCRLETSPCPWTIEGNPKGGLRPCDFHSVSRMAARGKLRDEGHIGRFGIGFVSVYQVTDSPTLRSNGIQLRLDPLRQQNTITPISFEPGTTEVELPWAFQRTEVRKALQLSPAPQDVAGQVERALQSVMREGLLFLRNLTRVELARSGSLTRTTTIERRIEDERILVRSNDYKDEWLVLVGDAAEAATGLGQKFPQLAELRRSPVIQVAFRLGAPISNGLLYAFLPTGQHTELPCHINADFFPRQDRRSIVTTGEGHERFFNEALLNAAADKIADRIIDLRDALGPQALWELIDAAAKFENGDPRLEAFWNAIAHAARREDLVLTLDERWSQITPSVFPPADLAAAEEATAVTIGLPLVHPTLRAKRNTLQRLGARALGLGRLVDALEHADIASLAELPPLWRLTERVLAGETGSEREALVERLSEIDFLQSIDGERFSVAGLYRTPAGIACVELNAAFPDLPLVSDAVKEFLGLYELIDQIGIVEVARKFSNTLPSEAAVRKRFPDSVKLRDLIELLARFEVTDREQPIVSELLRNVPFLPAGDALLPPSNARWPGGFVDPVGYLRLVDPRAIGPAGAGFVTDVLGVGRLTFESYLSDHLDEILTAGITLPQYRSLLREVVEHEIELVEAGAFDMLAASPLCRTLDGEFVIAREAYRKTEELEALLGASPSRWLDIEWLPEGHQRDRTLSLLERMGLGQSVAIKHLVGRIEQVVENPPGVNARRVMTAIVRHLLERWESIKEGDFRELEGLKTIQWVPVTLRQKQDQEEWHFPDEVQRPFASDVFYSQLPFIDLAPLRNNRSARAFLDFFDVPSEPPTEAIVKHLLWCAAEGEAPSENVYSFLEQRLGRSDGESALGDLKGKACIFFPLTERFRSPDEVFWNAPPFRTYWAKAGAFHAQREDLFRFIGVCEDPRPRHYRSLIERLLSENPSGLAGNANDELVYSACLSHLANGIGHAADEFRDALDDLTHRPFLLSAAKRFVFADNCVWLDAPQFAEPFGDDIAELVIEPLQDRAASIALFSYFEVPRISSVVELVLTSAEDCAPAADAAHMLSARAHLLSWLAPSAEAGQKLSTTLSAIKVSSATRLSQHAKFTTIDPPILSATQGVEAFFDEAAGHLYVCSAVDELDWSSVFAVLLPSIFGDEEAIDLPAKIMSAALVMAQSTAGMAERSLRSAGFRPQLSAQTPAEDEAAEDDVTHWSTSSDTWAEDDGLDEQSEPLGDEAHGADTTHVAPDNPLGPGHSGPAAHPPRTVFNPDQQPSDSTAPGAGRPPIQNGGSPSKGAGPGQPPATRTARFLTYVSHRASKTEQAASIDETSSVNPIDEAAMAAAMAYETKQGRTAQRQSQTNPGFDIISNEASGSRRIIEVKGLQGPWTDRGVKLTRTQFATAQQHGDSYWLYVIECATDPAEQKVHAIRNPFGKVEEYFFDQGWRDVIDDTSSGIDIRLQTGVRIKHPNFGEGIVEEVKRRGMVTDVIVQFRYEGRKSLLFTREMEFLDP